VLRTFHTFVFSRMNLDTQLLQKVKKGLYLDVFLKISGIQGLHFQPTYVCVAPMFSFMSLRRGQSPGRTILFCYLALLEIIAAQGLYDVPHARTFMGSKRFSVASPTAWNTLPPSIFYISLSATFKRHLKPIFSIVPM